MLNRLISLVFLLTFLNINEVYSENNFLLPQKKPSIFKKSEKQINEIIGKNLPVPKPRIKNKNTEKSTQEAEKTKVEKQKTKSTEKIISSGFVFPKKSKIGKIFFAMCRMTMNVGAFESPDPCASREHFLGRERGVLRSAMKFKSTLIHGCVVCFKRSTTPPESTTEVLPTLFQTFGAQWACAMTWCPWTLWSSHLTTATCCARTVSYTHLTLPTNREV